MKRKLVIVVLAILALPFLIGTSDLEAQCAMCRAVLESEVDNSQARGVNNGIMYLMAIPYILIGGVIYFVYRSRQKSSGEDS